MTTTHAQNFEDGDGDRAICRKTICIVFSTNGAKWTILVPLLLRSTWRFAQRSCFLESLLACNNTS
ncbi:hypothetical protein C8Q80DRAFT_1152383 [Daedaleopsis nitida]|nr:hypothetical protein C8Q80DRAFT_1152383 [Daedaleopsis nitida]